MKKHHQTITPAERDRLLQGGTNIAPGIWADADGDIHFSVPDLLKVFGWPDDAWHRHLVEQTVREAVAGAFPTTRVVDVDVES